MRTNEFSPKYQTHPPVLAVEVLSPESMFRDTNKKKQAYAAFGVENYWIVNPSLDKTGLVIFRRENGEYREVAQAFGSDVLALEHPVPMRIVPEWLIADGPWREKIGGPEDDEANAAEEPSDATTDDTTD